MCKFTRIPMTRFKVSFILQIFSGSMVTTRADESPMFAPLSSYTCSVPVVLRQKHFVFIFQSNSLVVLVCFRTLEIFKSSVNNKRRPFEIFESNVNKKRRPGTCMLIQCVLNAVKYWGLERFWRRKLKNK